MSGGGPRLAPLADRIREARERAGMTQVELAETLGTAQGRVSDLERGEVVDPHGSTLSALARALGVSVDWLLGLE